MMKSLVWKVWFLLFMLFCLLAYAGLFVVKLFFPKTIQRRLINRWVRFWGRTVVLSTGSTVEVTGQENLPDSQSICFISNHQGFFDIPLVLGFAGRSLGFIAKQELFRIPVLSWWMKEIPCVFIDRGSARKAIKSFEVSAEVIRNGHPLVIFPEGTRSRNDTMGEFHLGSLKLPVMAKATIVPLAIKGSWRVYEIDKKIHATQLKLQILPAIYPDDPIYRDKHALSQRLWEMIQTALDAM
ncbi:MAG TPA: lysophospholipid acyltransferase family protein [Candidatus Cloacimonadota bacterium]|nr:lysophospholipid acyltransferase family protein [Candidatus Cloacimonadota bacterium]